MMDADIDDLKHVPEGHRLIVEQFIIHNWGQLAADCYRNYLEQGRGMMSLFLSGDHIDLMYVSWDWLQLNWDNAFDKADRSMKETIKQLLPVYNPEDECVVLFESDEEELASVIRVTKATFLRLIEQMETTVPRIRRQEGLTPKDAYEQLKR